MMLDNSFPLVLLEKDQKKSTKDATSLPRHPIASMVNPRPSVSRRGKITQCGDEGVKWGKSERFYAIVKRAPRKMEAVGILNVFKVLWFGTTMSWYTE